MYSVLYAWIVNWINLSCNSKQTESITTWN